MATIRWCPIYPKWDSYQPMSNPHLSHLCVKYTEVWTASTLCCQRARFPEKRCLTNFYTQNYCTQLQGSFDLLSFTLMTGSWQATSASLIYWVVQSQNDMQYWYRAWYLAWKCPKSVPKNPQCDRPRGSIGPPFARRPSLGLKAGGSHHLPHICCQFLVAMEVKIK